MSIENTLERIAVALETIAGKPGGAASASPAEPAAAKASTPAKPAKKSNTESPKKQAEKSASSSASRADVLSALKALPSNMGRQILADHGATKLSDLDEGKYADVVAAAEAAGEE